MAFISSVCLSAYSGAYVSLSVPRKRNMVYSDYIKQRILFYRCSGKSYEGFVQSLAEEGHATSKVGIYKFIQRYEATGTIARVPDIACQG